MSKDMVGIPGESVSREDVACYRLYAANCVEIAANVSDTDRRLFLLRMAQAWGNLADQVEKMGNNGHSDALGETPAGRKPDQR
jgi:hypothetical protein